MLRLIFIGGEGVIQEADKTLLAGPPGDKEFVRSNKSRPRDINFLYHDPSV